MDTDRPPQPSLMDLRTEIHHLRTDIATTVSRTPAGRARLRRIMDVLSLAMEMILDHTYAEAQEG